MKSLFVKLPQAYNGAIETDGTVLHSVVIQGALKYKMPQNKETKVLETGSYFGSTDKAMHTVSNSSEEEIILYIRTNGAIKVK
jgi:3-methyladenine DNA glycosylase Mpg